MAQLRRKWVHGLGYTYDGVTPTKCQCNVSSGRCKCGHFKADREAELKRLGVGMPQTDKLIVTKRYTVVVPVEGTEQYDAMLERMVDDQDDDLHTFSRRIEEASSTHRRDLLALWMVEKYYGGSFTEVVEDWDYDVQRGTK